METVRGEHNRVPGFFFMEPEPELELAVPGIKEPEPEPVSAVLNFLKPVPEPPGTGYPLGNGCKILRTGTGTTHTGSGSGTGGFEAVPVPKAVEVGVVDFSINVSSSKGSDDIEIDIRRIELLVLGLMKLYKLTFTFITCNTLGSALIDFSLWFENMFEKELRIKLALKRIRKGSGKRGMRTIKVLYGSGFDTMNTCRIIVHINCCILALVVRLRTHHPDCLIKYWLCAPIYIHLHGGCNITNLHTNLDPLLTNQYHAYQLVTGYKPDLVHLCIMCQLRPTSAPKWVIKNVEVSMLNRCRVIHIPRDLRIVTLMTVFPSLGGDRKKYFPKERRELSWNVSILFILIPKLHNVKLKSNVSDSIPDTFNIIQEVTI
ncbi:hypothetical protein OSB04_006093 [Centaurea solstitialis]|uniref:Uncharacterized protein n=1 Tax=Centaurea solstitialis TaxID=347529 RepID=A0AA38U1W5_9ASTR|nr:hypothetical protein OSB04_006093 [Centaurea solstitialis]